MMHLHDCYPTHITPIEKGTYTGWRKSHVTEKKMNISTLFQSNELIIFSDDRGEFKVFFHKNQLYKYWIELSPLNRIQKVNLQQKCVNGILKTFCIRFQLLIEPFDRKSYSLSICARPSSLA
jgi:hypothetical protein